MAKPAELSEEYWSGLSERDRQLYALVRPMPKATYTVDQPLRSLEGFLASQAKDMQSLGGSLELEPDFQRGHVWTAKQQDRYVESLLRGHAPRTILFNCANWSRVGESSGDIPANTLQCIDGLQRLTAVRRFMKGDMEVFNGLRAEDLKGTPFDPGRYTLVFSIYEFTMRKDLLLFYLDLNSGGTVHTERELDRVRTLMHSANAKN